MPGYLQRLASAGARIVPSRGARVTQRAVAPATSRPAPSIGKLGAAPVGGGDTSRPASSAEKLEVPDAPETVGVARSRVESPAAVVVPPPAARQAKPEPQIAPSRTAIDPPRTMEQSPEPPVASEPAPLSFAVAGEPPRHKPPTYDETPGREADREPSRALPQMTVLTASEPSPRKANRTPEQHLQRLPRIEATPQASAKATPARSGLPPHPRAERIMSKLSEVRADLSLPPEQAPVAPPIAEVAPQFQSTRPEPWRPTSPAPAATPVGGLTIQRLEVQIVGRPRNEISEPQPAPVAPVGSAWDWPDRRHQERVW